MSAPPYMKLYVGDYLGDTHHLGALEHGAYLLLLMAMWRAGGTLPAIDANLARLARCTLDEWTSVRPAVMAFFKVSRGKLTHKRLAEEMAKYETVSRKRSEAVQERERKKHNKDNDQDPSNDGSNDPLMIAKPEPEPEPIEEDADASIGGSEDTEDAKGKPKPWMADGGFLAVWDQATDQMRGRAKSREKTWPEWLKAKRAASPERILAGLKAYLDGDPDVKRTGGPGLHIWLRDLTFELWAGEFGAPAALGPTFNGPAELRAMVVQATSETFAASYIDPSAYRKDDRVIEARTEFAAGKIRAECAAVLHRARVTVEAKPPSNDRSAA